MSGSFARLIALSALALAALCAQPVAASAVPVEVAGFVAELSDTQAGGHPDSVVAFELATTEAPQCPSDAPNGTCLMTKGGAPSDVVVDLPPGSSGNPIGVPRCRMDQLAGEACPTASQVGLAYVDLLMGGGVTDRDLTLVPPPGIADRWPVYNLYPERGEVAKLGFAVLGTNVLISVTVRPGDYGLRTHVENIFDGFPLQASRVEIWGVPYDTLNDPNRWGQCSIPYGFGCPAVTQCPPDDPGCVTEPLPPLPFLSAPTECVARETRLNVRSWRFPGEWTEAISAPQTMTGCNQLPFEPAIEVRPTTNLASAPTGLDVNVHIPQNQDPDGVTAAHMRDIELKLPPGLTVNPASASGLEACSATQIGLSTPLGDPNTLFDDSQVSCPDASKLGTARVDTPALDNPLLGEIFLATPHQNPFNSLVALYMAIGDEQTGTNIKIAGQVIPDPQTGQLTAVFNQNPQLPFEDLKTSFFSGPRASLKTPATCGSHTTNATVVPWTAPEGATRNDSDSFEIVRGPGGGGCISSEAQAPNNPAFSAGTIDPSAGIHSPFVLKLNRPDGGQQLRAIETTLPKGLLAKLAGTSYCSDGDLAAAANKPGKAEQASPSCPTASRLGSVEVTAGAGTTPVQVSGTAYLAGPYKGAPLSLAIVTPATAGPFDLGTVVVRNALHVDPESTEVKAVSDPIPTILQGIPLELRTVAINLDRPSFTLNPTSCARRAVTGSATSLLGNVAQLSAPFQVGGCRALGFKPSLALDLRGPTKRASYPALKAVLKARPGDANIKKAVVALPRAFLLAQEHIKTICTRVQFAADACPAASVYGKAEAVTPLLDRPISGPVYLRASSNPLPDLVADLRGQIDVVLAGRIDSIKGGIRTSFESVPDAPVTRFTLEMEGGKKGLLANSRNLCRSTSRATVEMDGQNGRVSDTEPVLTNDCKRKNKKKKARKGKGKQQKSQAKGKGKRG